VTSFDASDLRQRGFDGFVTVADLREEITQVPSLQGVYAALRNADASPTFLERSPASWFKGKDPTVSQVELTRQWVPGAQTLYIGSADNLRGRLGLLIEFSDAGRTRSVFHWGGRLLWQLADSDGLVVAWRVESKGIGSIERDLVTEFKDTFDRLPFANLRLPPVRP
jgi:hypothetical protein